MESCGLWGCGKVWDPWWEGATRCAPSQALVTPGQPLGNRITPPDHLGVVACSRCCAITDLRDYHSILHSCLKTSCPLSTSFFFTLNGFCRHLGRSMLVRACKYLQCNVHVIKPLQNFITFELSLLLQPQKTVLFLQKLGLTMKVLDCEIMGRYET